MLRKKITEEANRAEYGWSILALLGLTIVVGAFVIAGFVVSWLLP